MCCLILDCDVIVDMDGNFFDRVLVGIYGDIGNVGKYLSLEFGNIIGIVVGGKGYLDFVLSESFWILLKVDVFDCGRDSEDFMLDL